MDVLGGARRHGHRASLVPLSGFIQLLNIYSVVAKKKQI